ncbi:GAK system XXXCH domain-containing protein [Fundidesulfovibrio terrae]|uniref:GAK system XXXCH domain-containing protein n=1 Tax=Fundidesulfovibrio terrae TaxID=2922866 RepID=UPI001FAF394B|nr:GAK system XXXCH domain-containing protein [Fundidesulfovibrio terrae]
MSMSNKHKAEVTLEKSDLAGWLRGLAEAVEAGEIATEAGPVSLEGYRAVKISFKETFEGKVRAKLSVKFPRPALVLAGEPGEAAEDEESEEGGALPKYKSLKKHMKQTFKAIGAALLAGQMPPLLEAQSFIADSRLMVSYPGKGDEFYAAFLEKTVAFEAALVASDLEAAKSAYLDLAQLKRDCHSRYV